MDYRKKKLKGQTMMYKKKTPHRKQKIEQHEPTNYRG